MLLVYRGGGIEKVSTFLFDLLPNFLFLVMGPFD
jgi:hypothetical protein